MEIILKIIGLASLTVLFVKAEPLIIIKRLLGFKEELYDTYSSLKRFIFKLITCCMCSGWWIGIFFLSLSGNYNLLEVIELASIVSIISELLARKI